MIARSGGQVILVSGAVPGERVIARVERTERRLAFASVVDVSEPSIDRRAGFADPTCGGCVYSHIAYSRQLTLKSEIVLDAFQRLGRIPVDGPVDVAPSPERDYRMRSRFHVDGARFGFYREGTHTLCDAAATGQVSASALRAVASVVERLSDAGARASAIELTESVEPGQRAVSVTLDGHRAAAEKALARIATSDGLTGCAIRTADGARVESGDPHIVDSFDVLTGGRVTHGELRRHAESFFQANRFLVPDLVTAVLDLVSAGPVLDLYAGVGLFSIALAQAGLREITAVEGDRMSGIDLQHNARSAADAVGVVHDSVEHFLQASFSRPASRPGTVIVDPPRTGISAEAMTSLVKIGAPLLVYVSCDPATMARDARRLLDGRYRLESLRAFDLFPNTPHVECVGVFVG
jgi:23S rRNA (uracil1939-C5)-methyltransferase